jgi:hypothetical protein
MILLYPCFSLVQPYRARWTFGSTVFLKCYFSSSSASILFNAPIKLPIVRQARTSYVWHALAFFKTQNAKLRAWARLRHNRSIPIIGIALRLALMQAWISMNDKDGFIISSLDRKAFDIQIYPWCLRVWVGRVSIFFSFLEQCLRLSSAEHRGCMDSYSFSLLRYMPSGPPHKIRSATGRMEIRSLHRTNTPHVRLKEQVNAVRAGMHVWAMDYALIQ